MERDAEGKEEEKAKSKDPLNTTRENKVDSDADSAKEPERLQYKVLSGS